MSEKTYTAEEVAKAVLKKCQELVKEQSLKKAEKEESKESKAHEESESKEEEHEEHESEDKKIDKCGSMSKSNKLKDFLAKKNKKKSYKHIRWSNPKSIRHSSTRLQAKHLQ